MMLLRPDEVPCDGAPASTAQGSPTTSTTSSAADDENAVSNSQDHEQGQVQEEQVQEQHDEEPQQQQQQQQEQQQQEQQQEQQVINFAPMRATLTSEFSFGRPAFTTRILNTAIPETAGALAELEVTPSAATAHKLKGSYRTIFFHQAGEAAYRIEQMLRGAAPLGSDPLHEVEGLAAEIAELRRCHEQLAAAVSSGYFSAAAAMPDNEEVAPAPAPAAAAPPLLPRPRLTTVAANADFAGGAARRASGGAARGQDQDQQARLGDMDSFAPMRASMVALYGTKMSGPSMQGRVAQIVEVAIDETRHSLSITNRHSSPLAWYRI